MVRSNNYTDVILCVWHCGLLREGILFIWGLLQCKLFIPFSEQCVPVYQNHQLPRELQWVMFQLLNNASINRFWRVQIGYSRCFHELLRVCFYEIQKAVLNCVNGWWSQFWLQGMGIDAKNSIERINGYCTCFIIITVMKYGPLWFYRFNYHWS